MACGVSPRSIACAISVSLLLAAAALPAIAAQVEFAPGAQVYADYDTNRTLLPGTADGASARLAATLQATRTAEVTYLGLDARVSRQAYEGSVFPDVDGGSLRVAGRRAFERGLARAELAWSVDSAFEAERLASGIPAFASRQEQRRAGAGFRYQEGERLSLDVDASWTETRYAGTAAGLLRRFRYPQLAVTQSLAATERTVYSVTATVGELDLGLPGLGTRNLSAMAGWRCAFTERASLNLSVGATRQTRFGRQSSGSVAEISADFRPDDLTRIGFDAGRRVLPSGSGQLVARDSLGFNVSRGLTTRLSMTGGATIVRNRRLELGDALLDRYEYTSVDAGALWRPRPAWQASLRLYAAQGRQVAGGARSGANGIALSLQWDPHAREGTT